MGWKIGFVLTSVVFNLVFGDIVPNKESAKEFLDHFDTNATELSNIVSLKAWTYNTNITEYNSEQMVTVFFFGIYCLCRSYFHDEVESYLYQSKVNGLTIFGRLRKSSLII